MDNKNFTTTIEQIEKFSAGATTDLISYWPPKKSFKVKAKVKSITKVIPKPYLD